MKFLAAFIPIYLCITTSFVPTQNINNSGCQTIVDSANAFIQTSESAINTKPTINDNERNLRLDKWLQKLSFDDLKCLLDNENISIKVLGFTYAAISHADSLFTNYSHLLADTTTVQFFMANGRTSPKMKFGELLSAMTKGIKEDKDNLGQRPEIEELVSKFIIQYATYPSTYKPISFPYFSMRKDNKGLKGFKIHHDYEIKNNEGENVRVVSAFVLDKNLKINIIEKDSTTYSYSYPPKLGYWLKEFGRKLTNNDSIKLKLR